MTCQECELLLAGDERDATIDEHLATCSACRGFELDLRGNTEAFVAMSAEPMASVERPRPARWPYVAAAVTIAAVLILMLAIPKKPATQPMQIAAVIPPVVIEQTRQELPVVRHARKHKVQTGEPQILQVKMLTADPNVVIYWQIENKRGTE